MKRLTCAVLLALLACSKPTPNDAATVQNDTTAARASIAKLEAEVKAIAHTDGCASVDQCRQAPVGNRACGGPRYYIPYCAATTDSAALFRKLDELKAADDRLNKLTNAMSTCEMRLPPAPALVGGHCGPP